MVSARLAVAILLGALLAFASGSVHADLMAYDGIAFDPDDGSALYTERHLLREVDGVARERLVRYTCPGGGVFARKRVDYSPSRVAPDFRLDDGRDGYREGLRRTPRGLLAFSRERTGKPEQSAILEQSAQLVADAGFDAFVQDHWQALVAGDSLPLEFVVPSRHTAYAFRLKRIGQLDIGGVAAITFRLKVTGLLGLLAPQIDVSYAQRSRRLLRFEGVTNVRDDRGRQWTARIDFADRAAASVPDSTWDAALAEPLRACGH